MAQPSPTVRCEQCRGPIKQPKTGRPKLYCKPRCRREAQRDRDRDRARRDPDGLRKAWGPVTDDLLDRAIQLRSGRQKPLEDVLRLADAAASDIEALVAVAVNNARRQEESWEEIGRSAGMSAASARARWGGNRVRRLLRARKAARGFPPESRCPSVPAGSDPHDAQGDPGDVVRGAKGGKR
ncbi:hypothetical protein ACIQRS_04465 [Streptomyces termitum]|uniref:Uncharacterized protein n=1 Tax=Streptomyces termitum TaxID=67368 RepID=A0A918SY11_9ACTN|nr:hypothetical protein [Streptomyces termitum]GHA78203.1 hypothetical protein GCM10010305_21810 [Streptomyces termitum]